MKDVYGLRHDDRHFCKIHKRYMPYGRITCLLCELDSNDQLDTFAAERRRRLVDFFPKGRVAQLLPPKPDRF